MFTEEVEIQTEEPIKKEVIKVEIPAPKKKEENEEPVALKKEEKVLTPVFFDDNDFANLDPPKKVVKNNVARVEKQKKNVTEKKEVKKVFKPTPIISPVYGILDKNYHKEDIKTRHNSLNNTYYNKDVSIDDVRKKAYGTLEDDLEITLFGKSDDSDIKDDEIDMFDELMDDSSSDSVGVDDSDLFNLIDSVYEKDGEKGGDC